MKGNRIAFSIIMPTYNRAFCIMNAIDSLISQTYQDYELIIVDDGSTDSTETLLKEKYSEYFKNKKFIYVYQNNKGVCAARNNGLTLASNEWIAYLDTDNELTVHFLEEYALQISQNNNKCFYAQIFHSRLGIIGHSFNFKKLCKGNYIDLGVFVHHKSLIDKYGVFDTNLKRLVDWDLIIRFTKYEKPYFIEKVLLKYEDNESFNRITNTESLDLATNYIRKKIKVLNRNKLINFFKKEKTQKKVSNLIISLTSYPKRINIVSKTICSLLLQDILPEKIILWLAESQFPNKEKDLPMELLNLVNEIFEIKWCTDIRSYKKLIPSLYLYPDKVVITCVDDVIYREDCIEKLWNEYLKQKNVIWCHRGHYLLFSNNIIKKYSDWIQCHSYNKPSYNTFQTGVGAVLYPPNCFYKDVMNEGLFTKLSPDGDDIWFWAMAVLNGTKIGVVRNNIQYIDEIIINNTETLWSVNSLGANDIHIENILKYYPQIKEKISSKVPIYFILNKLFKVHKLSHKTIIKFCGIKFTIKRGQNE